MEAPAGPGFWITSARWFCVAAIQHDTLKVSAVSERLQRFHSEALPGKRTWQQEKPEPLDLWRSTHLSLDAVLLHMKYIKWKTLSEKRFAFIALVSRESEFLCSFLMQVRRGAVRKLTFGPVNTQRPAVWRLKWLWWIIMSLSGSSKSFLKG